MTTWSRMVIDTERQIYKLMFCMMIILGLLMIPCKQLYAQIRSHISHMCRFSLSLLSVIRLFSAEKVLVCSQYSLNSLGYKYNKVLETVHRDPGTSWRDTVVCLCSCRIFNSTFIPEKIFLHIIHFTLSSSLFWGQDLGNAQRSLSCFFKCSSRNTLIRVNYEDISQVSSEV